jgi:hypothetical protein
LTGGAGAHGTLIAGDGQFDVLNAGTGRHQSISASGDNATFNMLVGSDDTLSGSGDNDVFNLGQGDVTVIAGGAGDTINFDHDQSHMQITEDDPTDTVTITFTDTDQSITIVHDDQGIDLHFSSGPDQHLT